MFPNLIFGHDSTIADNYFDSYTFIGRKLCLKYVYRIQTHFLDTNVKFYFLRAYNYREAWLTKI